MNYEGLIVEPLHEIVAMNELAFKSARWVEYFLHTENEPSSMFSDNEHFFPCSRRFHRGI